MLIDRQSGFLEPGVAALYMTDGVLAWMEPQAADSYGTRPAAHAIRGAVSIDDAQLYVSVADSSGAIESVNLADPVPWADDVAMLIAERWSSKEAFWDWGLEVYGAREIIEARSAGSRIGLFRGI